MTATMNGMTAKLGEIARFGGKIPYDDPNSVPYRSWLVWNAMKTRHQSTRRYDGAPGYIYSGKLASVAYDLMPELAGNANERKTIIESIRYYLRRSGNAVCLEWGDRKKVSWWVSAEWRDVKVVPESTRYVSTYTERRLSKDEAGETRDPAPVTTRHVDGKRRGDEESDVAQEQEENEPLTVDLRWEREFIDTVLSRPTGWFTTVVRFVADRKNPFTPRDIENELGLDIIRTYAHLHTLVDMGLLQPPPVNQPFREMGQWWTTTRQRSKIKSMLDAAENSTSTREHGGRGNDPTAREILAVFEDGEWLTVTDVARRSFANRVRTKYALKQLVERGNIETKRDERDGRSSLWRLKAAPSSEPIEHVDPVVDTTTNDVADLAELLDDVIQRRVNVETVNQRLEIDRLQQLVSSYMTERDAAYAERDALAVKLDKLRGLLD